jgi:hypothetical protein
MRHVAASDSLQVAARYTEINLKIYGPLVATAANILCLYPTSKIAKDNMDGNFLIFSRMASGEVIRVWRFFGQPVFSVLHFFLSFFLFSCSFLHLVFCEMWSALVNDVRKIARQVAESSCQGKPPEPDKQVYLSLPRPGVSFFISYFPAQTILHLRQSFSTFVSFFLSISLFSFLQKHGTTSKPLKPAKLDSEVSESSYNSSSLSGKFGNRASLEYSGTSKDRQSWPGDETDNIGDGRRD